MMLPYVSYYSNLLVKPRSYSQTARNGLAESRVIPTIAGKRRMSRSYSNVHVGKAAFSCNGSFTASSFMQNSGNPLQPLDSIL